MVLKRCSVCKLYKEETNYFKMKSSNDSLQNNCKECKKIYQRQWIKEKVYSNPKAYIIHKMRCSLGRGNSLGCIKDHLGCTNAFFNDWLEYQRNRHAYHISKEELDHVLPVAHFKDMPKICWWWVNISPIEMSVNRSKSASIDYNLFKEQLGKAVDFLNFYPNKYESLEVAQNWQQLQHDYSMLHNLGV